MHGHEKQNSRSYSAAQLMYGFDESKHPRASDGKFGQGGGAKKGKEEKAGKEKKEKKEEKPSVQQEIDALKDAHESGEISQDEFDAQVSELEKEKGGAKEELTDLLKTAEAEGFSTVMTTKEIVSEEKNIGEKLDFIEDALKKETDEVLLDDLQIEQVRLLERVGQLETIDRIKELQKGGKKVKRQANEGTSTPFGHDKQNARSYSAGEIN